jgi:hypothetical protein
MERAALAGIEDRVAASFTAKAEWCQSRTGAKGTI